jgi:26S proteasome regulatory subunit N2
MRGIAATDPVRKMLQYARETQHKRIICGLCVIYYSGQDEADKTIKVLPSEKVGLDQPIIFLS